MNKPTIVDGWDSAQKACAAAGMSEKEIGSLKHMYYAGASFTLACVAANGLDAAVCELAKKTLSEGSTIPGVVQRMLDKEAA